MSKSTNATATLKFLAIGIAVVQLLDIIIHAATNQLEIIRVSSNLIMLVWLAVVWSGRSGTRFLPAAIGSIGIYLVLNIIFLAREGLTNAEQGGGLRVALFFFMFLTVALSSWLVFMHKNRLLEK